MTFNFSKLLCWIPIGENREYLQLNIIEFANNLSICLSLTREQCLTLNFL